MKTSNTNPNNGSVSGGNNTEDHIYLLSIAEANDLDDIDGSISGIGYNWWLRSPGDDSSHAAFVIDLGEVDTHGLAVDFVYGVRPALNLEF